MDECQKVPTEVEKAQVGESREAVGGHSCNSVKTTHTVTSGLKTFIIMFENS